MRSFPLLWKYYIPSNIRAGDPGELEVRGDKIQVQKQGSHWVIPSERLALYHASINFNKEELGKLHRRLGHPHPDRLLDLLKKAAPEELQKDTRKVLNTLYESCIACSKTKPKPLVFKAAVPDEIIFGHEVVLDMCTIGGKVVLHVVDRGTGFQAADFVVSQRAGDLWEQFLRIRATKYMSPDILTSDAGSAFLSQLWNESAAHMGIILRAVPVESHSSMGRGEHHGPLRRVYEKLRHDQATLDDSLLLSLAVKAVNECPNVHGFTPTTLVFGLQPKLPVEGAPTSFVKQRERLRALKSAQELYSSIVAKERLRLARDLRGPVTEDLAEDDLVHIYREGAKRWDTVGRVVSIDAGNVIHVQTSDRVVSPFSRASLRKYKDLSIHVARTENANDGPEFDAAKILELDGLQKRKVFRWVRVRDAEKGAVILPSRFVCTIKNSVLEGQPPLYKARLVAGGHRDPAKGEMVTEAPTVKATSVMVIIAVAMMCNWALFSRDVKQAFTQSGPLQRTVYLRPHKDVLRLSGKCGDWLLHLLIALYGLTEAPSYWWLWFAEYHMRDLGCKRTVLDPCDFYLPQAGTASACSGCIGTLVDDTIGAGNDQFLELEDRTSNQKLDVKPRVMGLFDFSGCRVEQTESQTSLSHDAYIQDLNLLEPTATFSDLRVARGKLAWISNTRPDVAVSINRLSQVSE
jgi:ribosomal protein S17